MSKDAAALERIDHNRWISKETDHEFWLRMERGLLLALQEQGTLTATQFRQAEEALDRRRAERARLLLEEGGA